MAKSDSWILNYCRTKLRQEIEPFLMEGEEIRVADNVVRITIDGAIEIEETLPEEQLLAFLLGVEIALKVNKRRAKP